MTPPILALAHGVHLDFPETLYHERVIGMASKSLLDRLHISPAHLRAYVDGDAVDDGSSCDDEESEPAAPADESKALRFGRALHTAILEPERFARAYTVAPVFGDLRATDRTSKEDAKANKIRRDEWRAANAGREILTAADSARIGGMASALRKFQPLAGRVIDKGAHEVTLRWRDAETPWTWTAVAAGSIGTITDTGGGSCVITHDAASACNDAYEVTVDFPTGGTRGTAGIKWRYRLGPLETFKGPFSLATATTIEHAGRHPPIALLAGDYSLTPLRERGDDGDRAVED